MDNVRLRDFIEYNVLTSSEAAAILKISKMSISKFVKEGVLTPVKQSSQGSLFLRADIEEYKKKKDKSNINRWKNILFCDESATHRCVKYFKEHMHEFSDIEGVFVFFNDLDAIINDYYIESDYYSEGTFRRTEEVHFILKDVAGKEMWLKGCNVGYGGTGPHGTADILRYLRNKGALPTDQFSDELIEEYIWSRKLSIIRDENNGWEIIREDSSFSDICHGASLYSLSGKIVLIQEQENFQYDADLKTLSTYQAFIPEPKQIMIFPTNEMAEEYGYVFQQSFGTLRKSIYNVIIIDKSGREIWLKSYFDNKKHPYTDTSIKSILQSCGFPTDPKELLEGNTNTKFARRIINWLDINFNSMVDKPLIIENTNEPLLIR